MENVTHHTIADLFKTLNIKVDGMLDFAILSVPDIHTELPFQSPVLRADYFSFILTKQGSGTYYLDEHAFSFGPGSFYFTNPGHIKSYVLRKSKEAYIITLTDKFLREYVHQQVYDVFPFLLAEIVPPKNLSAANFKGFEILYRQMLEECSNPSRYKNEILGNLFTVLLLKIKEEFWRDYDPLREGSKDSRLIKAFKKLLDREFKKLINSNGLRKKPRVSELAAALHLHPNYLSAVIRSKTGKTVNEWITLRTLSAAKIQLRNSTATIKEIANTLGFSEPTHFNRFFKQHEKITPKQYRNNS